MGAPIKPPLPRWVADVAQPVCALVLFVADLKAPTHGFLSVGGAIALVLGMAFLVNAGPVGLGVNPIVSVITAAVTRDAVEELGLVAGSDATATVKATSVMIERARP